MAQYLGWRHRRIHKANGVSTKGYLTARQALAHKPQFANLWDTDSPRISHCRSLSLPLWAKRGYPPPEFNPAVISIQLWRGGSSTEPREWVRESRAPRSPVLSFPAHTLHSKVWRRSEEHT